MTDDASDKRTEDLFKNMFAQARRERFGDVVASREPLPGEDLLTAHGEVTLRKAMGLYQAALKCIVEGGTVVLKGADGKERRWVPKP